MYKFFQTIKILKKLRKIEPSKAWLHSQRSYFLNMFKASGSQQSARPVFFSYISGFAPRKLRFASVVVMIILIVGLSGAVNSARAAMPNELLYPIKLLSEQFQSFFVFGNEKRVDFALQLAERRLEEAGVGNTDDEAVIVGTILRAEDNLQKAKKILNDVLKVESESASFKGLEKTLKRLDQMADKKEKLNKKFSNKSRVALVALERMNLASVNIEQQANQIIITVANSNSTSTSTSTAAVSTATLATKAIERAENKINEVGTKIASSTSEQAVSKLANAKEKLDEAKEEFSEGDFNDALKKANEAFKEAVDAEIELLKQSLQSNSRANPGTIQIVTLLTKGAGKSGKVPPGLLKAFGIKKKLGNLFDFPDDDKKDDNDKDDNDNDNTPPADITPPVISSISVSGISSSSAAVGWTTNELSTGKIYYSLTSSVDINSTSTLSQIDSTAALNHSFGLVGLNSSSTYYFLIEAKDVSNNIATSTTLSFTTSQQ